MSTAVTTNDHLVTSRTSPFPAFLVLVGASLAFSLARAPRGLGGRALHRAVMRRAAVLVCLGLLLNMATRGEEPLRVLGVLQRIGLTYLLAALMIIHLAGRRQVVLGGAALRISASMSASSSSSSHTWDRV